MSISSHEPDALRAQRRQKIRAEIVRYLLITLGCVLLGAGIALFLDPNSIAPGGISGVAIILNKFIPLNTGLLIFLLNIPLLLIGLIKFGKQFLFNTVYATIMLSLATDLISFVMERTNMTAVSALTGETLIAATGDLFLAAVAGGVLCAVGLGLVFRCNCTTGGLDIVVMLIHKKWRHLGVGTIFLIVDFVIAGVSAIVFESIEIGLYAAVGIAIYSVLMDVVIYGGNSAKFVHIVSDMNETIKNCILTELEIGVTGFDGVGEYTGDKKKVLMVVVKKHLYPMLRDIIREEDPDAFMIVTSAKEVYGLGYRSHQEDL